MNRKSFIGMLGAFLAVTFISLLSTGCTKDGGTESGLVLSVSEEKVVPGAMVSFTVKDNGKDVTFESIVKNADTGETVDVDYVLESSGVYRFYAEYQGKKSNEVQVVSSMDKKTLAFKFSATWCGYCPQMTVVMDKMIEKYPDEFVVMTVHCSDALTISEGLELAKKYSISGYPQVCVNGFRIVGLYAGDATISKLEEAMMDDAVENPACTEVSAAVSVSGTEITVDAKVEVETEGEYSLCVAVVEDNVYYDGECAEPSHLYSHLLRAYDSNGIKGTPLNSGKVSPGTYEISSTIEIDDDWNVDNLKVIAYVLSGRNVNDVVEVPVK